MDINDIKNPALKKLFEEVRHHSATIAEDAGDALEESSNDEELISNWQSKLDGLYAEISHFWGTLEQMKSHGEVNIQGGINCIRNPRIKCHTKAISAQPECAEHPACLLGMECSQKSVMAKQTKQRGLRRGGRSE